VVRRTLESYPRNVLHLTARDLCSTASEAKQVSNLSVLAVFRPTMDSPYGIFGPTPCGSTRFSFTLLDCLHLSKIRTSADIFQYRRPDKMVIVPLDEGAI
jgi:hypothetical protein